MQRILEICQSKMLILPMSAFTSAQCVFCHIYVFCTIGGLAIVGSFTWLDWPGRNLLTLLTFVWSQPTCNLLNTMRLSLAGQLWFFTCKLETTITTRTCKPSFFNVGILCLTCTDRFINQEHIFINSANDLIISACSFV